MSEESQIHDIEDVLRAIRIARKEYASSETTTQVIEPLIRSLADRPEVVAPDLNLAREVGGALRRVYLGEK